MSSTSRKHRDFVGEPMRGKRVSDLPGIGETLGRRLERRGYTSAEHVYGEYLAMDRRQGSFQQFMKETCNANSKQSSDCYNGLRTWRNEFM